MANHQKNEPAKQAPAMKAQELPEIRPSMGYTKRINIDHIVNDPKNKDLAFKVVNNENGQMQRHLQLGWKVHQEETMINFDFDPDAEEGESQVNRTHKGAARFPVGVAKSGQPVDAYLLYCSKASYEKALAEMEKVASAQIEMVRQGRYPEQKKQALEASMGGRGLTNVTVTEASFTNTTVAST